MNKSQNYLLEVREQRGQPVAESSFSDQLFAEAAYYRSFHDLSRDPATVLDFSLRLSDGDGKVLLSSDAQERFLLKSRAESEKGKSLLDSYLANRRAQLNPTPDQI